MIDTLRSITLGILFTIGIVMIICLALYCLMVYMDRHSEKEKVRLSNLPPIDTQALKSNHGKLRIMATEIKFLDLFIKSGKCNSPMELKGKEDQLKQLKDTRNELNTSMSDLITARRDAFEYWQALDEIHYRKSLEEL